MQMFFNGELHDVKFNEETLMVEVYYGRGFYNQFKMESKKDLEEIKEEFFGSLELQKEYKNKDEFLKLYTSVIFQ